MQMMMQMQQQAALMNQQQQYKHHHMNNHTNTPSRSRYTIALHTTSSHTRPTSHQTAQYTVNIITILFLRLLALALTTPLTTNIASDTVSNTVSYPRTLSLASVVSQQFMRRTPLPHPNDIYDKTVISLTAEVELTTEQQQDNKTATRQD